MPVYEYECNAGHQFEVTQRMSDDRLDTCVTCGAPAEQVLSASAFILKGGGWYAEGYGKKDPSTINDKVIKNSKPSSSDTNEGGSTSEKKSAESDSSKGKDTSSSKSSSPSDD